MSDDADKISLYGLDFPAGTSKANIELYCYANYGKVPKPRRQWDHLYRAICAIWPDHDSRGRRCLVKTPWLIKRCKAWCRSRIHTTWGPAASAKSTDYAAIALVDWYAAPEITTTIICSTTKDMLRRRIFGEIVRLHKAAKRIHKSALPGHYLRSRVAMVLNPDVYSSAEDDVEDEKAGIFGFAIMQGSKEEARDNIIGQHNDRVRLLIDESQHPVTEIPWAARANLTKGCQDFKLAAFGNPDSRLTPLGRYSEPSDGWESINDQMEKWETKLGWCYYFDGMKSPAIADPDRYPFLISKDDVEETIRDAGYDSPDYWQFARGFVRPEGTPLQIISESFAIKNKMQEPAEWAAGYKMGAGFDPSFSAGGDRRVVVPFQYGRSTWGMDIIAFLEPFDVYIEASKLSEESFSAQLVEKVIEHCKSLGVPKESFAMDTTGAQNVLADYFDEKWEEPGRIHRVEFGGAASQLPASGNDDRPAKDVYANRVTELWYNMVSFAVGNQIRNVPMQALKEFCIRQIVPMDKMRMRTTKRQIEPKSEMKQRTGRKSPDEADACVIGLDLARNKLGLYPMKVQAGQVATDEAWEAQAAQYDVDASDLYLTDGI